MRSLYDPIEGASPGEIAETQVNRLHWTLSHAAANSPLYRGKLADLRIEEVLDISDLPFTTKDDLRHAYPRGALAVGMDRVSYMGITSGTTGNPAAVFLTKRDAENMASAVARAYHGVGMGADDLAQLMVSVPMSWMWENSFRALGMAVVNCGIGNAEAQVAMTREMGTTVLVSTPSYLLNLARVAGDMGIDPAGNSVRILIAVGEPFGQGTRTRLETAWGADAYDGYGCMEMANGFVECPEKDGYHIFADHFLCEVVDPESGEVLGDGERGELVFTTLTREASPLIRYRTRDVVRMESGPCACGRTHPRIHLHGRLDDMIKIRGQSVYPLDLERALMSMDGIVNYQADVKRKDNRDFLTLRVESTDRSVEFKSRIARSVKGACNVTPEVVFARPGTLNVSGKTKRLIDHR
jgi:phenylacetate-CoA ligase